MATTYIDLTKHRWMDTGDARDPPLQTAAKRVKAALDSQVDNAAKKEAASKFEADFKKLCVSDDDGDMTHATQVSLFDLLVAQQACIVQNLVTPAEELTARQVAEGVDAQQVKKEHRNAYDAFHAVLCSVIKDLPAKQQMECVARLGAAISGAEDIAAELRLKQLMVMYNSLPQTGSGRYTAFQQILKHADATDQLATLKPYFVCLENWLPDWGLDTAQKHDLYLSIASAYQKLLCPEEQIKTLYTLLDMYESADAATLKKNASVARDMLVVVIDAAHVLDFSEYLGLTAVKALAKGDDAKLVEMVELLNQGQLQPFEKFKSDTAFFKKYGLNYDACLTKMRLLTLANYAQAGELPLSDVAKVLNMDEKEAEQWVVRAVSSSILNARVDQIKRVVLVKSAFQRTVGQDQWQKLHEQLGQWIGNLERISGVLAATRAA